MIDKKIEKLGYKKIEENKYGVIFRWEAPGLNRKREVAIMHKATTDNIIQVYDPEHMFGAYTAVDALTLTEMKLFLKKFKQMVRKYRW